MITFDISAVLIGSYKDLLLYYFAARVAYVRSQVRAVSNLSNKKRDRLIFCFHQVIRGSIVVPPTSSNHCHREHNRGAISSLGNLIGFYMSQ